MSEVVGRRIIYAISMFFCGSKAMINRLSSITDLFLSLHLHTTECPGTKYWYNAGLPSGESDVMEADCEVRKN